MLSPVMDLDAELIHLEECPEQRFGRLG
ncbi:MAG: hypothetical protein QOI78_5203, partial [Actinomycetota bacterium]|nr:hypothetical protein [Actinomycetota bacterium]